MSVPFLDDWYCSHFDKCSLGCHKWFMFSLLGSLLDDCLVYIVCVKLLAFKEGNTTGSLYLCGLLHVHEHDCFVELHMAKCSFIYRYSMHRWHTNIHVPVDCWLIYVCRIMDNLLLLFVCYNITTVKVQNCCSPV